MSTSLLLTQSSCDDVASVVNIESYAKTFLDPIENPSIVTALYETIEAAKQQQDLYRPGNGLCITCGVKICGTGALISFGVGNTQKAIREARTKAEADAMRLFQSRAREAAAEGMCYIIISFILTSSDKTFIYSGVVALEQKCAVCREKVAEFRCSVCKRVAYCSQACQAHHWGSLGHREVCKALSLEAPAIKRGE